MNPVQASKAAAKLQGCDCDPTILNVETDHGIDRVQLGHDENCHLLRQTEATDETVVIYRP